MQKVAEFALGGVGVLVAIALDLAFLVAALFVLLWLIGVIR